MVKVFTSKREPIILTDEPLAKGGEGSVYKVVSAIRHSESKNGQRKERSG